MYTNKEFDYLIIGQGLAGTLLSYQLLKRGHHVGVINTTDRTSSSYVAAGLLAPITGPRLAKTWPDDAAYNYACALYQALEQELNCSFYHPKPYIRILDDASLQAYAKRRLADPAYTNYISRMSVTINGKTLPAVTIAQAAHVDTTKLLDAYRAWLQKQRCYIEEMFDETAMQLQDDLIAYKDIRARNIIYCNGLAAGNSRFFPELAFNPTKGEIITIKTEHTTQSIHAMESMFVLPIGNSTYHVGATYERDYAHAHPTTTARDQLEQAYAQFSTQPYMVINHQAGIRPTTFGHHPYSFWHKEYPNIAVFSGFGSKGLSLIPAYARMLIDQREL
jgi:glycine/D-amino acid oxidase-like deaminating enzyme